MDERMAPDPFSWTIPQSCNGFLQDWLGKVWVGFVAAASCFAETSGMKVVTEQTLLSHVAVTNP